MLAALFLSNVTVARGGYRRVLVEALAFATAADLLLVLAAWRAHALWVAACILAGAPTVWVAIDALRRW